MDLFHQDVFLVHWILIPDIAKYIAENLVRDPESKVDSKTAAGLIIQDLGDLLSKTTDVIKDKF